MAGLADQALALALSLIFFLPMSAVIVRRLHDVGKSGWWIVAVFAIGAVASLFWSLLLFLEMVVSLIVLWWLVLPGSRDANRYGHPAKWNPVLSGLHFEDSTE